MKRFRTHIRTDGGVDWQAVLLSSLFVGVMLLMGPSFDTDDDAIIAWQLSGGAGSISPVISPYLSMAVSSLYRWFPRLAWWTILRFAGVWLFLAVMISQIRREYGGVNDDVSVNVNGGAKGAANDGAERILLYGILFAASWLVFLKRMNFTRTAAAFALAGIVLCLRYIFSGVQGERVKMRTCAAGVALFVLGCMIRFHAGLMVLPFPFVILFLHRWLSGKEATGKGTAGKGKLRTVSRTVCVSAVLLTGAVVFLGIANNLFWALHPEWEEYQTQNGLRAGITDHAGLYPAWEEAEEDYRKAGLEYEEDLDLYLSYGGYTGDPDVYRPEVLRSVRQMAGTHMSLSERILASLRESMRVLTEGKSIFWVLLLCLIVLWREGRKSLPYFAALWGTAFAMLFFFAFRGRIVLRVWEPVLMGVLTMGIFVPAAAERSGTVRTSASAARTGIRKGIRSARAGTRCAVCFAAALILMFPTGIVSDLLHMRLPRISDGRDGFSRARAEYIQSTPERIYLLSRPLFHPPPDPGPFGMWEAIPEDCLKNYFALSNWDSNIPVHQSGLEELGITNPVKALIERTDTYSEFMDDKTFRFLRRHYGSGITCSFVDEFPDGGAVLQYTAPIGTDAVWLEEKEQAEENERAEAVILRSEADSRYQVPAWNMEGRIDGWADAGECEALYCDMRKANGEEYTFRLAFEEDGSFHAFFYDVDEEWMREVEEMEIVSLGTDGVYERIGNPEMNRVDRTGGSGA